MDGLLIRSRAQPICPLCGGQGSVCHERLKDRLFGAPGDWTLKGCLDPGCGALWLDPVPLEEDLPKAYADYYTHGDVPRADMRVAEASRLAKAPRRFGKALLRLIRDLFRTLLRAVALGDASSKALDADFLKVNYGEGPHSLRKRWRSRLVALRPSHQAELEFSQMYLRDKPGGRLLEVGCGDGWLLAALAGRGWLVEGLDFDPAAIAAARARGLTVRQGSLAEQAYADETFDAVVMVHVVEHVPDPSRLLSECLRVLKPGGAMVVVTPNAGGLGHRWFGADWRGLEPPRHLHLFTLRALMRAAGVAGFEDSACRASVRDVHNLLHASMRLRKEGRFVSGTPMTSAMAAAARLLQTVQWAAMATGIRPEAGDELVLTAKRPQAESDPRRSFESPG